MKLISVYKKNKDIACNYMNIDQVPFIDLEDLLVHVGYGATYYLRKNMVKTIRMSIEALGCSVDHAVAEVFKSVYVRHDIAVLCVMSVRKKLTDRLGIVKTINQTVIDAQKDVPTAVMFITVPEEFVSRTEGALNAFANVSARAVRAQLPFYQLNLKGRIAACKKALETHNTYTAAHKSLNISFKTLKKYASM